MNEGYILFQAKEYARYRPHYPQSLFEFISNLSSDRELAWDCGTGNGQAAIGLSKYLKQIIATDISISQINNAFPHNKITYRAVSFEKCGFQSQSIDIIVTAQSLHWLNIDRFYEKVRDTLKPNGVFATWCYHLTEISPDIDHLLFTYYNEIVNPFWDPRIQYIQNHYRTIPFPFYEIDSCSFAAEALWDLHDIIGYLHSWSSTQLFMKENRYDPVEEIKHDLNKIWGRPGCKKVVKWPLYLRIGRLSH